MSNYLNLLPCCAAAIIELASRYAFGGRLAMQLCTPRKIKATKIRISSNNLKDLWNHGVAHANILAHQTCTCHVSKPCQAHFVYASHACHI